MWEPEPPTPAELRDQMEQAYQERLREWDEAHNTADQLRQQDSLAPSEEKWLAVIDQRWEIQLDHWAKIEEEVATMPTDLDPDDATHQIADKHGIGASGGAAMRTWTHHTPERQQEQETPHRQQRPDSPGIDL